MTGKVAIIEDADDAAVARWLAGRLAEGFATQPGPVAIAVPGGATPFPIIVALLGADLPWDRLIVWPTDDRIVAEDHPASNTGRLRALFTPAGASVVALAEGTAPPRFALTWLGIGADGHIASLFPSADPRADDSCAVIRLTPDPLPPEAPFPRITLTIPALLACEEILIVARGADKRAVLDRSRAGRVDTPLARLLAAARQPVTCFT